MADTVRLVCFDLDGTLLPMDISVFLKRYFGSIERYAEGLGLDGQAFLGALREGTRAMALHDDGRPNAEVFWDVVAERMQIDAEAWQERLLGFYEGPYRRIGDDVVPNPAAARAVETLAAKGYPLMLTTMPLFPRMAVEERLRWARIDPAVFARITDYENSTAAKPSARYYAENLAAAAVDGPSVLMVGNDTTDDLSFAELGSSCYLVTDWLLDPAGRGLSGVRSSSMDSFADWVDGLDDCTDPVSSIDDGLIPKAVTDEVLAAGGRLAVGGRR